MRSAWKCQSKAGGVSLLILCPDQQKGAVNGNAVGSKDSKECARKREMNIFRLENHPLYEPLLSY